MFLEILARGRMFFGFTYFRGRWPPAGFLERENSLDKLPIK